MSTEFHRFFIGGLSALIFGLVSLNAEPPSAFLSFEDYQRLITQKLAVVPELNEIWTYTRRRPRLKPIYLAGSGFRGFLEHLTRDLNEHGLKYVKKSPPSKDLKDFLPRDADKDMWAPDDVEVELETRMLCGWDVLGLNYIESIRQSQGSTLEWTAANAKEVLDLAGGLQDYYHGRHVLKLDLSRTGLFSSGKFLIDNSNLALALRFIRTTLQMPSATMTEESRALILDHIAQDRTVYPSDNSFIEKALWRIFQITGNDFIRTFTLLKEFRLLRVLARSKFRLKNIYDGLEHYEKIETPLKALGFTARDLKDVRTLLTPGPLTVFSAPTGVADCKTALTQVSPP